MKKFTYLLTIIFTVVLLTACGGSGGGSSANNSSTSNNSVPINFAPATITANVASGSSATITVRAIASDTSIFSKTLYAYVIDSNHVLTTSIELTKIDDKTTSATLHTSPTLAAGHYQGTLQVQLCNDANCNSQVKGSPVSLPYDFVISAAPLQARVDGRSTVTINQGSNGFALTGVYVYGEKLEWTAVAADSWLQLTNPSGTGMGAFQVTLLPSSLAVGNYSTTITIKSKDGQTVVLPFTLTVIPTEFVIKSGVPTFTAVNGSPIDPKTVRFELSNSASAPWTALSLTPWLLVSPNAGQTPNFITLSPKPSVTLLSSGSYFGEVTLSSPNVTNKTIKSELTLIKPSLSTTIKSLSFGGDKGREFTAQSFLLQLNTKTNNWPFEIKDIPSWLTTSAPSSVNESGTSVTLTPKVNELSAGSKSATINVSSNVNGDKVTLPLTVNLNVDQRRLLVSEWGVGFASTPLGSVLNRTIKVSNNFAGALPWTASTDVDWLKVTSSGNTSDGQDLVLTATPSSLANESLKLATITINSSVSGVSPAKIQVAIWKSANSLSAISTQSLEYTNIIADRIRPYVYTNTGGASIDVFNAHTGTKVTTLTNIGASIAKMTVSLDGNYLYALDTATKSMVIIDLVTMSKKSTFILDNAVTPSTSILATKPNGVEVILVGDGTAYTQSKSLGRSSIGSSFYVDSKMVTTSDGQTVFNLGARYIVDYSEMSSGTLFTKYDKSLNTNSSGNLRDVAINKDGTRVYSASGGGTYGAGYKCGITDGITGTFIGALPGGEAYPNNVGVTVDGRAICGISGAYEQYDIWIHSPYGTFLKGYKFAGYARSLKDKQMAITPDGLVVIGLTDDPKIIFIPIGQ